MFVCILGAWFFRANWYPITSVEILRGIAYGLIPGALGSAGYHLAATSGIKDRRRRRMYKVLFSLGAVLGAFLIVGIENKADREHTTEVNGLNNKIEYVSGQNDKILQKIVGAPLSAEAKEVERREDILTLLRNEYVLNHKDVSAGLLAGAVEPPSNWVNERLKQLGETWTIAEKPNPTITSQPTVPIEIAPSYGNLKQRTVDLAQAVAGLVQHRYDKQKTYLTIPSLSKDGHLTEAGWNEWAFSNDEEFRHFDLDKVKAIHEEFVELHIHDRQLEEILDRDDKNIKARQEVPQLPPEFGYISIFDMQTIGERLMFLANELPGNVVVGPPTSPMP